MKCVNLGCCSIHEINRQTKTASVTKSALPSRVKVAKRKNVNLKREVLKSKTMVRVMPEKPPAFKRKKPASKKKPLLMSNNLHRLNNTEVHDVGTQTVNPVKMWGSSPPKPVEETNKNLLNYVVSCHQQPFDEPQLIRQQPADYTDLRNSLRFPLEMNRKSGMGDVLKADQIRPGFMRSHRNRDSKHKMSSGLNCGRIPVYPKEMLNPDQSIFTEIDRQKSQNEKLIRYIHKAQNKVSKIMAKLLDLTQSLLVIGSKASIRHMCKELDGVIEPEGKKNENVAQLGGRYPLTKSMKSRDLFKLVGGDATTTKKNVSVFTSPRQNSEESPISRTKSSDSEVTSLTILKRELDTFFLDMKNETDKLINEAHNHHEALLDHSALSRSNSSHLFSSSDISNLS